MLFRLFLLFSLVPLIELWLLLSVGREIGALPTVALVIATAALGAALARSEGLKTLAGIQSNLAQGVMPGDELVAGALILFAGALLLTPGFVTDAVGFILLIPATRGPLIAKLKTFFRSRMSAGVIDVRIQR